VVRVQPHHTGHTGTVCLHDSSVPGGQCCRNLGFRHATNHGSRRSTPNSCSRSGSLDSITLDSLHCTHVRFFFILVVISKFVVVVSEFVVRVQLFDIVAIVGVGTEVSSLTEESGSGRVAERQFSGMCHDVSS
jgi:hypothetical protein